MPPARRFAFENLNLDRSRVVSCQFHSPKTSSSRTLWLYPKACVVHCTGFRIPVIRISGTEKPASGPSATGAREFQSGYELSKRDLWLSRSDLLHHNTQADARYRFVWRASTIHSVRSTTSPPVAVVKGEANILVAYADLGQVNLAGPLLGKVCGHTMLIVRWTSSAPDLYIELSVQSQIVQLHPDYKNGCPKPVRTPHSSRIDKGSLPHQAVSTDRSRERWQLLCELLFPKGRASPRTSSRPLNHSLDFGGDFDPNDPPHLRCP